jgi:hypothetical protein
MEDGVKDTTIDDARLAALLDGRLDAAEREDLLARLSESDDDYLVFADAAAILREREGIAQVPPPDEDEDEEDEPAPQRIAVPEIASGPAAERNAEPGVIPMRSRFTAEPAEPPALEPEEAAERDVIPLRPRRRFPLAAWGAIAAVLVGVALIPILRSRAGDPYDPARLAAGVAAPREEGWSSNILFLKRGAQENIDDLHGSARLGAFLVDLDIAVRAGDTAATRGLARAAKNASEFSGGGGLVNLFSEIDANVGEAPARMIVRVDEARKYAKEIADPAYFAAGAWTEAARLASRAHNAEFFHTRDSRTALEKILTLPDLSETASEQVRAIRAAVPESGEPAWTALDDNTAGLLRSLGA